MGELNQERWSRIERGKVALKEEKVPVTSEKKKASVRKETNAGAVHKTHWRSRAQAENFGEVIAADHKVLSEGFES